MRRCTLFQKLHQEVYADHQLAAVALRSVCLRSCEVEGRRAPQQAQHMHESAAVLRSAQLTPTQTVGPCPEIASFRGRKFREEKTCVKRSCSFLTHARLTPRPTALVGLATV